VQRVGAGEDPDLGGLWNLDALGLEDQIPVIVLP
jgi:hypothetical protein